MSDGVLLLLTVNIYLFSVVLLCHFQLTMELLGLIYTLLACLECAWAILITDHQIINQITLKSKDITSLYRDC